ncbi:MAG: hypothetical protein J0H01_30210 [Rhizobiales bacterium]|nr:hypothetical protein [Hyphomicrobiales bacterium]
MFENIHETINGLINYRTVDLGRNIELNARGVRRDDIAVFDIRIGEVRIPFSATYDIVGNDGKTSVSWIIYGVGGGGGHLDDLLRTVSPKFSSGDLEGIIREAMDVYGIAHRIRPVENVSISFER